MQRRDFVMALGLAAVWPLPVQAQQPKKVPRIGFIVTVSPEEARLSAFLQGLRELGYVDGQNIAVEVRAANSKIERFPTLASELVDLKVDVIVAGSSLAGRAAQQATTTIPIVVLNMGDPVADGLVANLARPGGNVTGLTLLGPRLVPKRLSLLQEALPSASKVVALWHPGAYGERTINEMMKEAEVAGLTLGLHLRFVAVQGPNELDRAFSTIAAEHTDAIMVFPSPMLFAERGRIVDLASKLRVPLIATNRQSAKLGGLLSYGADISDFNRRAATYVDRILKGTSPADLPVEQPTKYELVINLKTAKALGIDIPAPLLARANEVIE
jgi:putative ABC transport system substrate-binding protein